MSGMIYVVPKYSTIISYLLECLGTLSLESVYKLNDLKSNVAVIRRNRITSRKSKTVGRKNRLSL